MKPESDMINHEVLQMCVTTNLAEKPLKEFNLETCQNRYSKFSTMHSSMGHTDSEAPMWGDFYDHI